MGFIFEGSVCVVTGAASGIGLAVALALLAEGAVVVAADRDPAGLDDLEPAGMVPVLADIGTEAGVAQLIASVESQVGAIDLFMSNAGVAVGDGLGDDTAWDLSWRVNTMAHVWAARHLLPRMLARGSGYLVSTASAAGLLIEPGSAPYTLTKHAAVALAEWIAVNHGDVVGVSVVCPQGVDTPMLGSLAGEGATLTLADGVLAADDVAASVVAGVAAGEFKSPLAHE